MTLRLEYFKLLDLDSFNPKDEYYNLYEDMSKALDNPNIDMFTMWKGGEVICILGINHLRAGVGEIWLISGVLIDENKFKFYKCVTIIINKYLHGDMGIHRLQMAIEKNWSKGIRWAKSLGFIYEGLMKAYDLNKVDHLLFAKVV